ncbi:ferredoxin [Candidatus Sumerlaeota bacterium]|nr:ferredoxin [Candidatus Sumerlaeota bacterium]
MADKNNKAAGSAAGKYFVDAEECIACGICGDTAPNNIKIEDKAFVSKQATSADEENALAEAKDSCPVQAIGDDGE